MQVLGSEEKAQRPLLLAREAAVRAADLFRVLMGVGL